MLLGLPLAHIGVLIVQFVGIVLPFLLITHARHARKMAVATMIITIVGFALFLWFDSHASERADLVLLRCYTLSSSICSLGDEVFSSARQVSDQPTRLFVLVPLGIVTFLTLCCLVGGISGAF